MKTKILLNTLYVFGLVFSLVCLRCFLLLVAVFSPGYLPAFAEGARWTGPPRPLALRAVAVISRLQMVGVGILQPPSPFEPQLLLPPGLGGNTS